MQNMKLHLKAVPHTSSAVSPSLTRAFHTGVLCGMCPHVSNWNKHRCTTVLPFADKHMRKIKTVFFKASNMKMVFTSVRWYHAECWVYPVGLLLLNLVHRGVFGGRSRWSQCFFLQVFNCSGDFIDPFGQSVKYIYGETIPCLMVHDWHGLPIIILHMRTKWGVIIDLSCTSAHSITILSAQLCFKAKTLSGRAHLKPF